MKATEVAAWVGAGTGTAALVWDVIKWKSSGASLKVSVSPDMKIAGGLTKDPKDYMSVFVVNRGRSPTTLTGIAWYIYPSRWAAIRGRGASVFLTPNPITNNPIPVQLAVGGQWVGTAIRDKAAADAIDRGLLYCRVDHATMRKPTLVKVRRYPVKKRAK